MSERVIRFIFFAKQRDSAIPLFIKSNVPPVNLIYYCQSVANLVHDVVNENCPKNIPKLFPSIEDIHSYETRSAFDNKLYTQSSRLKMQLNSFSRIGVRLWNSIPSSVRERSKFTFKKIIRNELFSMLQSEECYLGVERVAQLFLNGPNNCSSDQILKISWRWTSKSNLILTWVVNIYFYKFKNAHYNSLFDWLNDWLKNSGIKTCSIHFTPQYLRQNCAQSVKPGGQLVEVPGHRGRDTLLEHESKQPHKRNNPKLFKNLIYWQGPWKTPPPPPQNYHQDVVILWIFLDSFRSFWIVWNETWIKHNVLNKGG